MQIFSLSFIENNWTIKDIETFINKIEKKINDKELLYILIEPIKKNKLQLQTKNKKGQNIIDIINTNDKKDLELLIKQLCAIQEIINKTTDNQIEDIVNELRVRNNGKLTEDFLNQLKDIYKKIIIKYNDYSPFLQKKNNKL